jgi:hypothetical protein
MSGRRVSLCLISGGIGRTGGHWSAAPSSLTGRSSCSWYGMRVNAVLAKPVICALVRVLIWALCEFQLYVCQVSLLCYLWRE